MGDAGDDVPNVFHGREVKMNILDCVPTGKNVLLPKDAAIRQLQQIYDSMSEVRLCAHSGADLFVKWIVRTLDCLRLIYGKQSAEVGYIRSRDFGAAIISKDSKQSFDAAMDAVADAVSQWIRNLMVQNDTTVHSTSSGKNSPRQLELRTSLFVYTIGRQLGEGGNAVVYEVEREGDHRKFAAKILRRQAMGNPEKVKRFKQEVSFSLSNKHDNIVSAVDIGTTQDGMLFYVMPLAEATLRRMIEDRKLSESERVDFVRGILGGLSFLHENNVIHRDIKPENILIVNRIPKIADVGIAHFSEADLVTSVSTRDNERLANFRYAAPEQRKSGGLVTCATDVYSVALVIHEMMTGELAVGTGRQRIGSLFSGLGAWDVAIDKALSINPDERPQSAKMLLELLFDCGQEKDSGSQALPSVFGRVGFVPSEEQIDAYMNFATVLSAAYAGRAETSEVVMDVEKVIPRLNDILSHNVFESHIQDLGSLLRCFINGDFQYKSSAMMSVDVLRGFLDLVASLDLTGRRAAFDSLRTRLSNVPVQDPESEIPF